jgi:cyd operon protein YbgT
MRAKSAMAKATLTKRYKSLRELNMWYFAWILGLPLAAAFAVLNAMWFEMMEDAAKLRAAGVK